MTKFFITLLSTFLLSNIAWAQPYTHLTESNSLYQSVIEKTSMSSKQQLNTKVDVPYTHKSEQYNSLSRAALAKQGININLRVNAASEVSYSRYDYTSEKYNSLSRGALAK